MKIVISPAKRLDFKREGPEKYSKPKFIDDAAKLVEELKKWPPERFRDVMNISNDLSKLNFERYQNWEKTVSRKKAKQAVFAFKGDVYQGMDIESFTGEQLDYTQDRLRILSGLYGYLKPLDLIMPYRLEMGSAVKDYLNYSLYEFWSDKVTEELNKDLKRNEVLVNLASKEYFQVINTKKIKNKIVTPAFKDMHKGKYKTLQFFTKKARGFMARFILQNQITDPDDLLAFDLEGYVYNPGLSKNGSPVFTREQ